MGFGDRGGRVGNGVVQIPEAGDQALGVVGVVVSAVGVDLAEFAAHDLGVLDSQVRRGPEVRVRVAALLGEGEVEDVLVRRDGEVSEQDDRRVI